MAIFHDVSAYNLNVWTIKIDIDDTTASLANKMMMHIMTELISKLCRGNGKLLNDTRFCEDFKGIVHCCF
jgi:hypothetical protein